MEEKKKQICLRLTEEEKIIIEDSTEIENAINKLSAEIEAIKDENRELKRFEENQRESFRKTLEDTRSTYEVMMSALKETIKSKQILIENQETKKGFWSRLFKR